MVFYYSEQKISLIDLVEGQVGRKSVDQPYFYKLYVYGRICGTARPVEEPNGGLTDKTVVGCLKARPTRFALV